MLLILKLAGSNTNKIAAFFIMVPCLRLLNRPFSGPLILMYNSCPTAVVLEYKEANLSYSVYNSLKSGADFDDKLKI